MPQDSAHFDDPGLKVALRTLQSGQTAPSAVRDRLRARLTAARGELDLGRNDESQSQSPAALMPAPKKHPSRTPAAPPVPQSVPPLRIAGTEADRKPAPPVVASRPGFRIGPWL